jgi:hypothetical protein
VVDSETQRVRSGSITFNLNIARVPSICPSRLVLFDERAPADLSGYAELFRCDPARIRILGVAASHSSQPSKTNDLARTRLPMPGPHELAGRSWRNFATIDLQ